MDNDGVLHFVEEVYMVSALEAAGYLVFESYGNKMRSLTPLKLQKLLYLAQGWSYVWDNRPLFDEEFQAWQYGPVNVEVYNHFKRYGRGEIPIEESICALSDKDVQDTLTAVWRDYSDCSASELVELTHTEGPWLRAFQSDGVIKNEQIKHFFQSTY